LNDLLPGVVMAFLMWLVYYVEVTFSINFNSYGIVPQKIEGLRGIVFSPFIHGSLSHLWSNTIPTIVLMFFLFRFYRPRAWQVLILGGIGTGVLTWLIASSGRHIGASGVIYMLVFFLMLKGFINKKPKLLVVSFVVVFFYGSLVWYVLPVKAGMSWEGHLSGAISGIAVALLVSTPVEAPIKYEWEQEGYNPDDDPFLRQFDENGNFIELVNEEEE
jgi:membrane associated rhomboid family serine protease